MLEAFIAFLVQNYGVGIATFMIFLITLVKWSDIYIKFASKIVSLFRKEKHYFKPEDVLKLKMAYWLDFKIRNIDIKDAGRRQIFRDILQLQFQAVQKNLFKIEKQEGFDRYNGPEFYGAFVSCMYDTVKTYETQAHEMGIPSIVMVKFNEWHSRTVDFTLKSAELISGSSIYKNNFEKMQAMYSLYTAMLELTIAEAEKTLTVLNGELTGTEYKGVVCG